MRLFSLFMHVHGSTNFKLSHKTVKKVKNFVEAVRKMTSSAVELSAFTKSLAQIFQNFFKTSSENFL